MTRREHGDRLRAGIFVLFGILVFVLAVFVLGKKSALFSPTDTLFVTFKEVNGLVVGAPVRLAGLEIGSVAAISFPENLRDKRARVRLAVRSAYMPRIREDSRAFIDSNGLLGDKIINISLGDPAFPPLRDGSTLTTGETLTFEALATTLHDAIGSAKNVVKEAELLLGGAREGHVQDDIKRITSSLANVLNEVETGDGSLHQLIYEPSHARELGLTLVQAHALAGRANLAMERIDRVLAEVERGDGSLHKLVYEPDAANAARELASAAHEIAVVVKAVREGKGLAHSLIFDEGGADLVAQLDQLSTTLNRMAGEVDRGRGTIGGLIKDPTVYEDLKTVLGNVQRNVLFKALIRSTIENDGLRRADEAPQVTPTPAP